MIKLEVRQKELAAFVTNTDKAAFTKAVTGEIPFYILEDKASKILQLTTRRVYSPTSPASFVPAQM